MLSDGNHFLAGGGDDEHVNQDLRVPQMNVISCHSRQSLPPTVSLMLSVGNYFLVGGYSCCMVLVVIVNI